MTEKDQIRTNMKQMRRSLSEGQREEFSRKISEKVLRLEAVQRAKRLFIYLAFDGEVETRGIIQSCFIQGKEIFVPVVGPQGQMDALRITEETKWKKNQYGILEPIEGKKPDGSIDLAIVPGLAFDEKRFRLGYGAGYYDRYFYNYAGIYRVGLAYDNQIFSRIPAEAHDTPMDQIVTENRIL